MNLKSIQFTEFENEPRKWVLSKSTFGKISLIVGKNASGKTRTMNVISGLAKLLRGDSNAYASGDYNVNFEEGGISYNIELSMNKNVVTKEIITVNGVKMLSRDIDGTASIYTKEVENYINFKVQQNQLASVVRNDPLQHEFLAPLHVWANSLVDYRFADDREKQTMVSFVKNIDVQHDIKFNCIRLLKNGIENFGEQFKKNILLDLRSIGYFASDVGVKHPNDIIVSEGPPIHCLYLDEDDLECLIEQHTMSNGMFRALALLIKINYLMLDNIEPVLIIDDIGEGLDFSRCRSLVKLIIQKAMSDNIQIIMSTNDQFIMDGVPLEYWAIANRKGPEVSIINKENASEAFDKFKFIGLNNFEFFASEFFQSLKA